jgi:hypothetical protein
MLTFSRRMRSFVSMDKTENKPLLPESQKPDESALLRALSPAGNRHDEQTPSTTIGTVERKRVWKTVKQKDVLRAHRPFVSANIPPNLIPHVKGGPKNGCACEKCRIAREEFEWGEAEAQIAPDLGKDDTPLSVPEADADLEVLMLEMMDEDFAGYLADTPRAFGELLIHMNGWGEGAEKIFAENPKEIARLGKVANIVWKQYAKMPNFKHKALLILLAMELLNNATRTTALLAYLKKNKPHG